MKSDGETIDFEIHIGTRKGGRPATTPQALPGLPRVSRLMALALKFQGMVDRREVPDYAELARLGYVTRARLTQIMNLLLLAPEIQERLLFLTMEAPRIRESQLRKIVRTAHWPDQRRLIPEGSLDRGHERAPK